MITDKIKVDEVFAFEKVAEEISGVHWDDQTMR